MQIEIDRNKLAAYGLSILDIVDAINKFSSAQPAGRLTFNSNEFIIRVDTLARPAELPRLLGLPITAVALDKGRGTRGWSAKHRNWVRGGFWSLMARSCVSGNHLPTSFQTKKWKRQAQNMLRQKEAELAAAKERVAQMQATGEMAQAKIAQAKAMAQAAQAKVRQAEVAIQAALKCGREVKRRCPKAKSERGPTEVRNAS